MAAKWQRTSVPGVYKRGARYLFSFRHRGRQRWGTARTLDEARRLKRQAQTDVDRGERRQTSRVAFGEYAREWIDNYSGRTARGLRESTRAWYREMLEQRLIPYFDHERGLRLAEIEPRDVKALHAWLEKQPHPRLAGRRLSKSTVKGHAAVLRALLADATEEGLLRSNPAAGIRVSVPEGDGTGRDPADERRVLSREELVRLLGEVDPRWRLFFELMAQTGVRIGEAVELRWGRDVRFGNRPTLKVNKQWADGRVCDPKTKYGKREIPLSPRLARQLWQAQGRDGGLVFTTTTGTRLNRWNHHRDALRPAAKRAGVPWVTFHTLRHTCASMLFAPVEQGGGGKNVKQVQEWLGHHSPAFTLTTYVHLLDDGLGDADFFDALEVPLLPRAQGEAAVPAAVEV